MKKLFIILIIFLTINYCNKAEAFWNPFEYIHFAKTGSGISDKYNSVKDTIDGMISAYESRNISSFMKHVSEDYIHDEDILESKIRSDFLKYSFIRINYVINNIIPDNKGKYSVSINFTEQMENRASGRIIVRSGTAVLILKEENSNLKLYSMRKQRLFGITNN